MVEQWSPKPKAGSSSLSIRANKNKKEMLSIINFLRESVEEVTQKVSWPSQEKVQESLNYFIIGLFIAAVIVGAINIGFDKAMERVYSYFK